VGGGGGFTKGAGLDTAGVCHLGGVHEGRVVLGGVVCLQVLICSHAAPRIVLRSFGQYLSLGDVHLGGEGSGMGRGMLHSTAII